MPASGNNEIKLCEEGDLQISAGSRSGSTCGAFDVCNSRPVWREEPDSHFCVAVQAAERTVGLPALVFDVDVQTCPV